MPGDHAVIAGDVILEDVLGSLEKTTYREQDTGLIIRTEDFLLNKRKDTLLVKVVVVEDCPQAFYVMVNKREGELTVRFDPTTDPEKTEGSEIALALICKHLIKNEPSHNLTITRTNIGRALQKMF